MPKTKLKKGVLYLRVSSDRQAAQNLSIPSQDRLCREYAQKQGIKVVRVFTDAGESARTDDRPAFLEAIDYVRTKENDISAFICYDTSRFARNREDAIVYKRLLRRAGVSILFVSQNIDRESESGFVLEGILELFDEYYSRALSRQARRGMIEAAKKGFFTGGGVPYGFYTEKVFDAGGGKHSVLRIHSDEAETVRLIFKLYSEGLGYTAIVNHLDGNGYRNRQKRKFSRRLVESIISNPLYIGQKVFGRTYGLHKRNTRTQNDTLIIENYCPPILTRDLWDKVQNERSNRDRGRVKKTSSRWLFSGLLYCAKHNRRMRLSGGTSHTGKLYYYFGCPEKSCSIGKLPAEELEEFLLEKILSHVLSDSNIDRIVRLAERVNEKLKTRNKSEKKRLEKSLQDVERRIKNILQAIEIGVDSSDIRDRFLELSAQKETIISKLSDELEPENKLAPKAIDYVEFRTALVEMLSEAPVKTTRSFLRAFLVGIYIGEKEILITYRADLGGLGSQNGNEWLGSGDYIVNSKITRSGI